MTVGPSDASRSDDPRWLLRLYQERDAWRRLARARAAALRGQHIGHVEAVAAWAELEALGVDPATGVARASQGEKP